MFHNGNVSVNGKITYYPIYLMMFLEHPQLPDDLIYAPGFFRPAIKPSSPP